MGSVVHELSIAMSLVDVACEQAESLGARIEALHVRLGPLSGVVVEALAFSFTLACDGTPIAGARLVIETMPIVARCTTCSADRVIASAQHLHCPVCGDFTPDLIGGRELELFALEVEEDVPADR